MFFFVLGVSLIGFLLGGGVIGGVLNIIFLNFGFEGFFCFWVGFFFIGFGLGGLGWGLGFGVVFLF